LFSCVSKQSIIRPKDGYDWPSKERSYWPSKEWQTALIKDHHIDPAKMELAGQFAQKDELSRALLVVRSVKE